VSWQLLFTTCQQMGYSEDDLQATAQEMADLLFNLSRNREVLLHSFPRPCFLGSVKTCLVLQAAVVYEQYVNDSESAIVTLIEGGCYSEALR